MDDVDDHGHEDDQDDDEAGVHDYDDDYNAEVEGGNEKF